MEKKGLVAGGELRISRRDGVAIVRRSGFSRELVWVRGGGFRDVECKNFGENVVLFWGEGMGF